MQLEFGIANVRGREPEIWNMDVFLIFDFSFVPNLLYWPALFGKLGGVGGGKGAKIIIVFSDADKGGKVRQWSTLANPNTNTNLSNFYQANHVWALMMIIASSKVEVQLAKYATKLSFVYDRRHV